MRRLPGNAELAIKAYVRGRITATDLKSMPIIARCVEAGLERKMNRKIRYMRWQRRHFKKDQTNSDKGEQG